MLKVRSMPSEGKKICSGFPKSLKLTSLAAALWACSLSAQSAEYNSDSLLYSQKANPQWKLESQPIDRNWRAFTTTATRASILYPTDLFRFVQSMIQQMPERAADITGGDPHLDACQWDIDDFVRQSIIEIEEAENPVVALHAHTMKRHRQHAKELRDLMHESGQLKTALSEITGSEIGSFDPVLFEWLLVINFDAYHRIDHSQLRSTYLRSSPDWQQKGRIEQRIASRPGSIRNIQEEWFKKAVSGQLTQTDFKKMMWAYWLNDLTAEKDFNLSGGDESGRWLQESTRTEWHEVFSKTGWSDWQEDLFYRQDAQGRRVPVDGKPDWVKAPAWPDQLVLDSDFGREVVSVLNALQDIEGLISLAPLIDQGYPLDHRNIYTLRGSDYYDQIRSYEVAAGQRGLTNEIAEKAAERKRCIDDVEVVQNQLSEITSTLPRNDLIEHYLHRQKIMEMRTRGVDDFWRLQRQVQEYRRNMLIEAMSIFRQTGHMQLLFEGMSGIPMNWIDPATFERIGNYSPGDYERMDRLLNDVRNYPQSDQRDFYVRVIERVMERNLPQNIRFSIAIALAGYDVMTLDEDLRETLKQLNQGSPGHQMMRQFVGTGGDELSQSQFRIAAAYLSLFSDNDSGEYQRLIDAVTDMQGNEKELAYFWDFENQLLSPAASGERLEPRRQILSCINNATQRGQLAYRAPDYVSGAFFFYDQPRRITTQMYREGREEYRTLGREHPFHIGTEAGNSVFSEGFLYRSLAMPQRGVESSADNPGFSINKEPLQRFQMDYRASRQDRAERAQAFNKAKHDFLERERRKHHEHFFYEATGLIERMLTRSTDSLLNRSDRNPGSRNIVSDMARDIRPVALLLWKDIESQSDFRSIQEPIQRLTGNLSRFMNSEDSDQTFSDNPERQQRLSELHRALKNKRYSEQWNQSRGRRTVRESMEETISGDIGAAIVNSLGRGLNSILPEDPYDNKMNVYAEVMLPERIIEPSDDQQVRYTWRWQGNNGYQWMRITCPLD